MTRPQSVSSSGRCERADGGGQLCRTAVTDLEAKRLGLLRALVPTADLVAMLVNPDDLRAVNQISEAQAAASSFSQWPGSCWSCRSQTLH